MADDRPEGEARGQARTRTAALQHGPSWTLHLRAMNAALQGPPEHLSESSAHPGQQCTAYTYSGRPPWYAKIGAWHVRAATAYAANLLQADLSDTGQAGSF